MSKIPKRFHQYFKYAVSFKCKIIPPPKTSSEQQFIIENLQKLATVDILKSTKLNLEEMIKDGFQLKILFNPAYKKSMLLPVSIDEDAEPITELQSRNVANRDKLVRKLDSLIAIPRYLYVENDEKFLRNERQIQFTHELSEKGRFLTGKYDLSLSSIENPIVSLTRADEKLNNYGLRAAIRHNVLHFHKFQSIEINTNYRYILSQLESNSF